jgi:mono/diheme cytochrome c family protein
MAFVYEYLEDPRPRREGLGATRMPDFRLSSRERLALALAIGSDGAGMEEVRGDYPEVDADDGRLLFSVLGCAGCHGGLGTGEEVLGGVGIGPSLEGTGSRLQGGWLRSFLEDPVEVRPSGHAPGTGSRMPDFRLAADEVDRILAYLQERRLDEGESGAAERALPALSPWGRARAEGYLTDRLSCLGCHSWRGEGGRVGPSLDGIVRRLTPEEVVRVVLDPGAARPGTVMPPSPFAPRILDQVAALLVGDSAAWAPPVRGRAVRSALRPVPWKPGRGGRIQCGLPPGGTHGPCRCFAHGPVAR